MLYLNLVFTDCKALWITKRKALYKCILLLLLLLLLSSSLLLLLMMLLNVCNVNRSLEARHEVGHAFRRSLHANLKSRLVTQTITALYRKMSQVIAFLLFL